MRISISGPVLVLALAIGLLFFDSKDIRAERRNCDPCTEVTSGGGCASSGKRYCGSTCYDPSYQHCKMCGSNPVVYSGDEPTCCGVMPCGGNLLCCLGKCYDPNTQVCCRGNGESSVCSKSHISGPTCCGSECDYPDDALTLCCGDAPSGSPYLVGLGYSCCFGMGVNLLFDACCQDSQGNGYPSPRSVGCGSSSSPSARN